MWISACGELVPVVQKSGRLLISVAYYGYVNNTHDSSSTMWTSGSANASRQPHTGPPNVQWQLSTPKRWKISRGEASHSTVPDRFHHIPVVSVINRLMDTHGAEMPELLWHPIYTKPLARYLSNACMVRIENAPVYRGPLFIIARPRKVRASILQGNIHLIFTRSPHFGVLKFALHL